MRPRSRLAAAALIAAALVISPFSFTSPSAQAAPTGGAFTPLRQFRPTGTDVRVQPSRFTSVRVDPAAVRAALGDAPRLGSARSTVFAIPTPTGGTEHVAVQRSSVMQGKLAAAHPELQTWSGRSLDHPGTSVALDLTPMGFHASVRGPSGQGTWYIDPAYNRRGTAEHLVYRGSDLPAAPTRLAERELPELERREPTPRRSAQQAAGGAVVQRVYRLALLNDPSYARYFGSGNVLAEKVTLINRVDQVYDADAAITLVLVDGTEKLNLDTEAKATGANGPCGAHSCYDAGSGDDGGPLSSCTGSTLLRNQTVLGQLIGASNYDVGHIALGVDGGGVAGLGVVGGVEKAAGCTGIPDPVGDGYAIDFVAHELGHQFGGNHTFNGVQGSCAGGNRVRATSVEPGSGSSIMAYAGICQQDDLQPHSDPYFSQRSIDEFSAYTSSAAQAVVEVQDISLSDFGKPGDTITLDYPGASAPITLTYGSTYSAADLEAAVEKLTGKVVTIADWGHDPYADDPGRPDRTGFEVIFAADSDPYTEHSDRTAAHALVVTGSAGVGVHVGETARGGPANNRGETHRTGNHDPVVTAPAARTLPIRTPFTLTGSARDADGDPLTYLWEQNDTGGADGTGLVDNAKLNGPLFRVFGTYADVSVRGAKSTPSAGENAAGTQPTRTFPDLAQILSGNTNARSGRCPAVAAGDATVPVPVVNCYSEFLPIKGYVGTAGSKVPTMHFRLTARDDVANGGGLGHADVALRIDQQAGPFLVSSFAQGGSVKGGSRTTVRWQVNGTRPLAANVQVVLSTDGGTTWTKVLARLTANDGAVQVTVPKIKTRNARIMVRAVGNYFFDVSDSSFRIS